MLYRYQNSKQQANMPAHYSRTYMTFENVKTTIVRKR